MRLFRNTVSLMCALALLLSLAPAAFAEDTGDVTITNNTTVNLGVESEYRVSGELTVNENITLTITDDNYTEVRVDKGLTNNGTFSVSSGEYTFVDVDGKIDNNGSISVSGDDYASFYGENVVNGAEKTITVTGGNYASLDMDGKSENNGTIEVKTTGNAATEANISVENFVNKGTVEVSGESGSSTFLTSYGTDLNNEGTIQVKNNGTAKVQASVATINNSGSIEAEGSTVVIDAEGVENHGTMTLNGDVNIAMNEENFHNYNTVIINGDADLDGTYYGVNFEQDGVKKSALLDWKDGKVGNEATLDAGTKDGYKFNGWELDGQRLEGNTVRINNGPMSIKALWEKIINNIPIVSSGDSGEHVEKAEKSGEKIVKYIDAKVLDADRRELEPDTEYYKVAKTSYNRLIVTFTWQQMAEMEEGEHLYYIVTPDGVETEYTLTIW